MLRRMRSRASIKFNGTVHRAAADDVDLRTRAARGSACNGLLCYCVELFIRTARTTKQFDELLIACGFR